MESYKQEFIEFMVESKVLKFGAVSYTHLDVYKRQTWSCPWIS